MKKFLTKEELLNAFPVINITPKYQIGEENIKEKEKKCGLNNPIFVDVSDDFIISKHPGLGYIPYNKPKFIKFQRGESVEYVQEDDVKEYTENNSYSMYLMKKWMKEDIEKAIHERIIRPRAILNWQRLCMLVIKNNNKKIKDSSFYEFRYQMYKTGFRFFQNDYTRCLCQREELEKKS